MENKAPDTNYNFKKIVLDVTLLISGITITVYIIMYYFERGLFLEYGIPDEFIGIDYSHVKIIVSGFENIAIVFYYSILAFVFLYAVFPKTRIQIDKQKHLILIIPVAYSMLSADYNHFWHSRYPYLVLFIIINMVFFFLDEILELKSKWVIAISRKISPSLKLIRILVLISFYWYCAMSLFYFSYFSGMTYAKNRQQYPLFENEGQSFFLLTKNSDGYICTQFFETKPMDSVYYYYTFKIFTLDEIANRNFTLHNLTNIRLAYDLPKAKNVIKLYKEEKRDTQDTLRKLLEQFRHSDSLNKENKLIDTIKNSPPG